MTVHEPKERENRRLERQFQWIEGLAPAAQRPLSAIRARGWWIVRVPLALLLILGGLLAFLPVLGIWMLPLGLLLLAVDVPVLRPIVSRNLVRLRRRVAVWVRWWRQKRP